jgi:hypothetical protein
VLSNHQCNIEVALIDTEGRQPSTSYLTSVGS